MSRRTLFLLLLVVFLDAVGFGIVYPLFPELLFGEKWQFLSQGASELERGAWLGLLLSITPIAQMLVSPFAGSCSDRFGRRPVIICCLGIGALGYVAAALSVSYQSLFGLLISRILIGVAIASFAIVMASIADISEGEEEKGKRFAYANMAFAFGFVIGPPLGGFLFSGPFFSESIARPFWVNCFFTVLNAFCAYLWLPETRQPGKEKEPASGFFASLRVVSHAEPRVLPMLLAAFFFSFGWALYLSTVPVWWIKGLGFSNTEVSFLLSLAMLLYVIICPYAIARLLARFSARTALLHGLGILALLLGGTGALRYYPLGNWFLYPVQMIVGSILCSVVATLLSSLSSKEHQGRVMGLLGACEALGWGVAPFLSGISLGINILLPSIFGGIFCLMSCYVVGWRCKESAYPKS